MKLVLQLKIIKVLPILNIHTNFYNVIMNFMKMMNRLKNVLMIYLIKLQSFVKKKIQQDTLI